MHDAKFWAMVRIIQSWSECWIGGNQEQQEQHLGKKNILLEESAG
jgi:hypothetical protein